MKKKPNEILDIISKVSDAGYEIYYAGQCVTAEELGEAPLDWDMYTDCPQEKIREMFPEGRAIGKRTTRIDDSKLIVSTDVNTPDTFEGVVVDIVTLEGSIEEQLKIYDFTCEAIAKHPVKLPVDLDGGLNDIARKIIRPTGDIEASIEKNPIIMLKALKYVGIYGFDLSRELYDAMNNKADLLKTADKEEILYYFTEAINGNNAGKVLKMIKGMNLLPAFVGDEGMTNDRRGVRDYDTLAENIDKLKHISLRRLALFYICFDKHYEKAVQYLPHDEEDMALLLGAKKQLPKLHFASDEKLLKKFICKNGWDGYSFYDKLAKAQIIVYDYNNQRAVGRDEILKKIKIERHAIFLEDLRIDEDDILEAGYAKDRERAHKLLEQVLDVVHDEYSRNERDKLMKYAKAFSKSKLRAALRDVSWIK